MERPRHARRGLPAGTTPGPERSRHGGPSKGQQPEQSVRPGPSDSDGRRHDHGRRPGDIKGNDRLRLRGLEEGPVPAVQLRRGAVGDGRGLRLRARRPADRRRRDEFPPSPHGLSPQIPVGLLSREQPGSARLRRRPRRPLRRHRVRLRRHEARPKADEARPGPVRRLGETGPGLEGRSNRVASRVRQKVRRPVGLDHARGRGGPVLVPPSLNGPPCYYYRTVN
mmetsp:Transcript_10018/g.21667  ORF Transcript_10018/g.21667 Transcript_10018/m.21667 type:complete len:224 (+) Transcript_10018:1685-2356(+)